MLDIGIRFVILMLALVVCFIPSGCNNPSETVSNAAQAPFQDDLTASEILSTTIEQYQNATSYSDNGVLYLTYRINGRWIQEPQPFSTQWTNSGRFAADLFNARVRCDGQQLSCYVFDIQTGNLDNQHMLIPATSKIPLNDVFDDRIAGHFLKGFSEFPLDEMHQRVSSDLIPMVIGMLTGQQNVRWITHPQQLARLPDQSLDDMPCFVLQMADASGTYILWIDQHSGIIHQVDLPLNYLDSKVLAATEITDLSFTARFHQAQLNAPIPEETFAIKERIGSTLVRHFVELPESFPCEMIGQTAPDFQLYTPDDRVVNRLHFDGKVSALFWLGDIGAKESIEQLDQLMGTFDRARFNFSVIYSDAELADPLSKSNDMNSQLKQFVTRQAIRTEFFCDRNMNTSTLLKLKSVPSVIVMDPASKIQFAVTTADVDWIAKLSAAMNRVANGDDVAAEMKSEYQAYLETYHQQLLAASTSPTYANASQVGDETAGGQATHPALKPSRRWTNTQLVQPGNLIVTSTSNEIFVLDGWQTIVQLDTRGKIINRVKLDLPDGHAINQLRTFTDSSNVTWFAGFSMLGKKAFVFDENWHLVAEVPTAQADHRGISDCLFGVSDSDQDVELLVSFADQTGVQQIEINTNESNQLFKLPVKSMAYNGRRLLAVANDEVVDVESGKTVLGNLKYRSLFGFGIGTPALAVGSRENGGWELARLDTNSQPQWTVDIGSQFFENEIAPICQLCRKECSILAVADAEGSVKLFSENGQAWASSSFRKIFED